MTKKVKVCLCLFSGRTINGLLHQQNFVFHHGMPNKKQHRCPMSLDILQNLAPWVSISFASFGDFKFFLRLLNK